MSEKKNKVEKQKTGLLACGIGSLVAFAATLGGAIYLLLHCQYQYTLPGQPNFVLELVWGIILAILCIMFFFWGIYAVFTSRAIKATKGSIADPAIFKGTVNGVKCPKCGCTNTPDVDKCENCGTPLK